MSRKLKYTLAAACLSGASALSAYSTYTILQEEFNLFLPDHIVLLHGDINDESANHFIEDFENAVQNYDGQNPVTVRINSQGGSLLAGQRIIASVEQTAVPVVLHCEYLAASMAAQILITTEGVQRDASENCRIVLHAPHLNQEGETITLEDLYFDRAILLSMYQEAYENADREKAQAILYLYTEKSLDIRFLTEIAVDMIEDLAASTNLTEDDFINYFAQGDTYFYNFYSGVFGFIDTVEGEPIPEHHFTYGPDTICITEPELSICNITEEENVPAPEF